VERGAGLSFAGALRHILRQDPDIIMIGEIRDEETARIAIQAAITGHVVLSTLHTNDAAGVIERLSDMEIEPYLAAAALNGVISQRLVRRICKECRVPAKLTPRQARILRLPIDTPVFSGEGCSFCNSTGFHSRFAVYEYIIMDEKKRRRMSTNPEKFAASIRKQNGLRENVLRSLLSGFTTADEVIRALNRGEEETE
jgi:type IV pilus assembly protein PilB